MSKRDTLLWSTMVLQKTIRLVFMPVYLSCPELTFVFFPTFIFALIFHSSPSFCHSSHALRSRGVLLRSPELLLRVFLALSCAWRYFSIMLLCFLLSLSLHHILSQYSSTCGRFDGPMSCMISLNHMRDWPIWLDELPLLYALQGIQALKVPVDRSLIESEFPVCPRDMSSSTVSPWRTSRVMRANVCVKPCSRERQM